MRPCFAQCQSSHFVSKTVYTHNHEAFIVRYLEEISPKTTLWYFQCQTFGSTTSKQISWAFCQILCLFFSLPFYFIFLNITLHYIRETLHRARPISLDRNIKYKEITDINNNEETGADADIYYKRVTAVPIMPLTDNSTKEGPDSGNVDEYCC